MFKLYHGCDHTVNPLLFCVLSFIATYTNFFEIIGNRCTGISSVQLPLLHIANHMAHVHTD